MGRIRIVAVLLVFTLTLTSIPAAAQTLFQLGDTGLVAEEALTDSTTVVPVDVDFGLLRSAPRQLRLSAPDGRELLATLNVFEDRGNGNLLWRGRVAGAAFDGVVLTVEEGVLVGRFGDDRGSYRIQLAAGGQSLSEAANEAWNCEVQIPPWAPGPVEAESTVEDKPQEAAALEQIDVLALYTRSAAERMGGHAGMQAVIRNAGDYLNTVFGNSEIDAQARLVHIAPVPADLESTDAVTSSTLLKNFTYHAGVRALRKRHRADLVHLFYNKIAYRRGVCGRAWMLSSGHDANSFSRYAYAITTASRTVPGCDVGRTFAHEVAHNLGAGHDPPNTQRQPHNLIRPYAYGYVNEAAGIRTIMAFGPAELVPYFSTVATTYEGAALGVAGKQDNARALRATVSIGSRYGAAFGPKEAPTGLTGYATSDTSVLLTWKDNSSNEASFEVLVTDRLAHRNLDAAFSGSLARTVGANTVQVELDGLGKGYYAFAVRARNEDGASETSNVVSFYLPLGPCAPSESISCLQRGRFEAWVSVWTDAGRRYGKRLDLGDASTLYYFFEESNVEMLLKVLDGCAVNDHIWVYAAAATDLRYEIQVWDTSTGVTVSYYNPPGTASPAITDSVAFATCGR